MFIVYFSSATENTHRFVQKLPYPSARIPLREKDPELLIDTPYVLICPTYGGGAAITGAPSRPVPIQVIKFLNNAHNRHLLRGVIASGNLNFGVDFAKAGDVIAHKCQVPYLYRFELMGTPEDIQRVRVGLDNFEKELRQEHWWDPDPG